MSEAPIAAEPPLAEGTDGTEGTAGSQGAEGFRRSEGLDAHLVVRRGDFRLDVSLTAAPGDVVALLGPNGAGKTTALRALAGLTPLTGGHLRLDGAALERTAPESRPVGVVFQDYLLFPHLTALDNIAFGPRCQGLGKAAARAQAAEWLDRMGLAEYAGTKPRRLSGGQAQRVALARALATRPRLLLLDEPLAALDARTRLDVRAQLRRHLAEFDAVAVLVTHDPLDAMVLADRLVVVEHGRVVQEGTPGDIARHPRTDYIAHLVGLNLYRGRSEGHVVRLDAQDPSGTRPPGPAVSSADTGGRDTGGRDTGGAGSDVHGSGGTGSDAHGTDAPGTDPAVITTTDHLTGPVFVAFPRAPSPSTATGPPAPAPATSGGARWPAWRCTATRSVPTSRANSPSPPTSRPWPPPSWGCTRGPRYGRR